MLKIFVRFVLFVFKKNIHVNRIIRVIRDIRVQNIISGLKNIISGLKNIISVQNIAIASAASAASAAIVSAMLMFSFLITFSVS